MKKLIILIFLLASYFVKAQDIQPTGTNFKSITSHSISYYVTDSTVWIFKGATYGWTKLASYRNLKRTVDSLAHLGYTKVEVNNLLALKAPSIYSPNYIWNTNNGSSQTNASIDIDGTINTTNITLTGNYIRMRLNGNYMELISNSTGGINIQKGGGNGTGNLTYYGGSDTSKFSVDRFGNGYFKGDLIAKSLIKTNGIGSQILMANGSVLDTTILNKRDADINNRLKLADISNKVDKIPGKKLSTKDYTETDSLKLAGLTNPTSFELEISTSGTTDIALPFTLKSTALVFVNNSNIRNNLWTGSGTSTITLFLDTKQKDFLKIQNQ